jgi:DNA polymerase-3 subunit alpha
MFHTNFVHLHVHSHYSILDGAASVKNIIETARRYRMPAIAITDHGNMFGAIEFYQAALKRGIKPIVGFEAYMAPGSRHEKARVDGISNFHLVLLAKNFVGYQNLVRLSSIGYLEGFYGKPRIDWEVLEKYHEGLIAMTACLHGELPMRLLRGEMDKTRAVASRFRDLFGKDDFYVEIQNHGLSEQIKVLPMLVDLARELDLRLVATNDSHYVNPEDWESHDAMICLQTQSLLGDEKRMRFGSREFYLKSPQLMTELFSDFPEALENTVRIADRCNLQLTLGKSILPNFPIPQGKTADAYLEEICRGALLERYPNPDDTVNQRLDYELSVIRKMGFSDYFLIVWDFIREARHIGVPVGPGRGSAAGSIVAYLLKITNIDPLRYGLLFERFLNPDRISMPDIDIDFSDDGRERVIKYVEEKYGSANVSQIITFNCILAKLAIRDVGRIMEIPLKEIDRIAKLVPDGPGVHLRKVVGVVPELKQLAENGSQQEKKLFRIAETIDGLVRHTGIHAAGVVISREPLSEIVPMFVDKSKVVVTQYEKNALEKIGLLKMDFLGLKTLTVIKNALAFIKETREIDVDVDKIPLDDKKTYDLLCAGNTQGVFQLESSGMRSLITRLKPSVFEDIIALLAMYRPGPLGSGMVDDFVERKHGRKKLEYPHPDLEPILKDTYGVFLYQEQCMFTANVLADFTMGQADQLRKAMAKKNPEDMEKMGRLFVEGAVKRKIPQAQAQSIFDLMASFGEYGFNKSHSAAYALVTFHTAYLKAYYPVEFMAAVLSSEINDTDKIKQYIDECFTMSIPIEKPDVNKSKKLFSVEEGKIRFGLNAIKGVGGGAVDSIIDSRKEHGTFKSLFDFTRRVDTRLVNNRVVESLVKAGGFDCLQLKRSQLLAVAADVLKSGQQLQKERETGQGTFFDIVMEEVEPIPPQEMHIPDLPELSPRELLSFEKESLGFFLSGNPFEEVAPLGRLFSTHRLSELEQAGEGTLCCVAGLLTAVKKHTTKKGDIMAFVTLEADDVSQDVSIFPATYQAAAAKLILDEPLFMRVKVESLGGNVKVNAENLYTLDDLNQEDFVRLTLLIPPEKAKAEEYPLLLRTIKRHPGTCALTIKLETPQERITLKPPPGMRITLSAAFIREWEKTCGKGTVKADFRLPEVKNGRQRFYRKESGE